MQIIEIFCKIPRMIRLHHELHGTGSSLLVLISGHQTTIASWRSFWKPLTQKSRILLLDNRGMGLSPASKSGYAVSDMAADVVGLMDSLKMQDANIFGHSMGGAIAQAMAKNWPTRVKKLIIASSFTKFPVHATFQVKFMRDLIQDSPASQRVGAQIPWVFGETFLKQSERVKKEIELRMTFPRPNLENFDAQTAALLNFDSSTWLKDLSHKALIIGGDEDMYVPFRHSEELHKGIAHSSLIKMKGVGHNIPVEAPQELAENIETFLRRD